MSIPSVIAEAQAHYEKAPTGPLPYTIARPLLEALIAAESQLSACRALIEQWREKSAGELESCRQFVKAATAATARTPTALMVHKADEESRALERITCADELSVLLRGE